MNDASLCADFCDDANAFFFHRLVVSVKIAIAIVADNDSS